MMKFFKKSIVTVLLLQACLFSFAQVQNITVKGKIKGMKKTEVIIYDFDTMKSLGRGVVNNGVFSVNIKADIGGQKCFAYFSSVDDGKRAGFRERFFFVDNSTVEVTGRMRAGKIGRFKQVGSEAYDVFGSIEGQLDNSGMMEARRKLQEVIDEGDATTNQIEVQKYKDLIRAFEEKVIEADLDRYYDFIKTLKSEDFNIGLEAKLYEVFSPFRYSFIVPVIEMYKKIKGEEYFAKSYYAAKLLKRFNIISMYIKGTPCLNSPLLTLDGEYINFSKYKGKKIYVHLWDFDHTQSSDQLINFQTLAKKMKSKNVVFLNIGCNENVVRWKLLAKELDMPDVIQLSMDIKYEKEIGTPHNQTFKYGYKAKNLPSAMIIDENFKMIDFNAMLPNNPNVKKYLKDILKK